MSTTDDPLERGMEAARAAVDEARRTMERLSQELERDTPSRFAVHFLDMGAEKYGDCIVLEVGDTRVLIDGGHPGDWRSRGGVLSLPQQIGEILEQEEGPYEFDLLIVTHAHRDHIGCLPRLVEQGRIVPRWALVADPDLGWSGDGGTDAAQGSRAAGLVLAALREESQAREQDPAALWEFLLDAERQQSVYREMLGTLRGRGTRVVTFLGSDDERPEYRELLEAMRGIGLEILGPTREHLRICAAVVDRIGRDAADALRDSTRDNVQADAVDLYRQLAAADAGGGGLGAALNDQSIVAVVEAAGRKILLTGDMQLAIPGILDLDGEMRRLRQEISSRAPFDLVKIAHHAAENALDESVLDELRDSRLFVISTGRDPRDAHPAPEVLNLLHRRRDELEWARTDRNGLITFLLHEERVRMLLSSGAINDESPNALDAAPLARPAAAPPAPPPPAPAVQPPLPAPILAGSSSVVEVTARVPHQATRVTITIDVQPQGAPVQPLARPLLLAGGRLLPPLLFVTSRQALAGKIGAGATELLLQGLHRADMRVVDVQAELLSDAATAARPVHEILARPESRGVRGVVLLGGYDVLPSQRFDCLDPDLEAAVDEAVASGKARQDPDDFLVWSDDIYGDTDGNSLPELPVSRIPDGGSASLLWAALESGLAAHAGRRRGVRNVRRPFAESIFGTLPGQGEMLRSEPSRYDQNPPIDLAAEYVYLMLHGEHADAAYYLGESDEEEWPRALGLQNIPRNDGAVVLAGCCWGALPVREPAALAPPDVRLTPHTPESSIALRFLASGARAFVGCTGAHYSPGIQPPVPHFGSPMHEAFWLGCCKGSPPAQALLEAKLEYLQNMPHGLRSAFGQAVEEKTLRQFTCLGLGW